MDTADELHLRAIAQAQQGQLATAIQLWQQALQQDPKHFLSWQNLAVAQYKAYDFAHAAESNKQALQLATDSESQANLHLNLGAALAKLKDFDGAIAHYQAALKLKPD
ncbi:MAG: tetratricopeptide repeat protein, partial [Cyanobacteria bacterium P01_F01_bin.153]